MNILAIRFARLGDVILLLPALASIKRSLPQARLTLLTGHRCAPIAEMCPSIDEVISVDRIAMRDGPIWKAVLDGKKLVSNIRGRHFEAVIDFHSFRETNLLTWLSGAGFRVGMRRCNSAYLGFCFNQPPVDEDKTLHVAEMFQRVAGSLPDVRPPVAEGSTLRIPARAQQWADDTLPPGPLLALYVDAPVPDRRWPSDSFAAVGDYAAQSLQAQTIVLSSASNALLGGRVRKASHHPESVHVFSDLSLPQLAAAIRSSRLLISNDTGPMHLGPALGVSTLGLFSVGLSEHFRPIGPRDRILKELPIERISVERVIKEVCQMWPTAGPGLQR